MTKRYVDDVLREDWDDETRTYTEWDENGVLVPGTPRPYTEQENAQADSEEAYRANHAQVMALQEATKALTAASLALQPEPTNGGAWVQPTGAHDAYPAGAIVTHGGKTWESLTQFNVWAPGVSGWREQVAEGYPAWVQPTGAHDAYALGAQVSHNGQNWESTNAANTWEPGVFGWNVIP